MKDHTKHFENTSGIDADDQPDYPVKDYTGNEHGRLNDKRYPQQEADVETHHSNRRPTMPAASGTSVPYTGLSGTIRRLAFRFSEGSFGHWFPLILADRVNVVEELIEDVIEGHFPDLLEKTGIKKEWQEHPERVATKAAIGLSIAGALVLYLAYSKRKPRKRVTSRLHSM